MRVILDIINSIEEDIAYYKSYQWNLQKWIVNKKHKNTKQHHSLMEEFKTITIYINELESYKIKYENLLYKIQKLI